jgi:hypothetical protein
MPGCIRTMNGTEQAKHSTVTTTCLEAPPEELLGYELALSDGTAEALLPLRAPPATAPAIG